MSGEDLLDCASIKWNVHKGIIYNHQEVAPDRCVETAEDVSPGKLLLATKIRRDNAFMIHSPLGIVGCAQLIERMTVTKKESFHPVLIAHGSLNFKITMFRPVNTKDILAPTRNWKITVRREYRYACQQYRECADLRVSVDSKPGFKCNFPICRRDHGSHQRDSDQCHRVVVEHQNSLRFSSKSSFTGYKSSLALPICGKSQARTNVLLGKVREIAQNLLVAHAGCEIIENVVNSDSQAPNARLAAALARFDGDDLGIIHRVYPMRRGSPRQFAGELHRSCCVPEMR